MNSLAPVLACAVCFGDPNSPMTKSVWWAVIFLLVVVGMVLGGILTIAISWAKRSRKLGL